MNVEITERLRSLFAEEAEGCLLLMDECILVLAKNPTDRSACQGLARAAHTLAGNAAAIGYNAMLPDAQTIEMIVAGVGPTGVRSARLSALMNARSTLRRLLNEFTGGVTLAAVS